MRRCVMCDAKTPYSLDPSWRGKRGPMVGLCGPCFNDPRRLEHAVAFANATWRKR